jgi:hypothetical protein
VSDQGIEWPAAEPLSVLEQDLVDHIVRGDRLDCAGDGPVDLQAMRSWDDSYVIRAWVLRDILRGCLGDHLDPHGLRLRGARIAGRLDLENITTGIALELIDCFLDEGLDATDANLAYLGLDGCWINHPADPAIAAERLTTAADVSLTRANISSHCEHGAVRLLNARIGGELRCTDATIHNPCGPALGADSLHVGQNMVLDGLGAGGSAEEGAVRLPGAHIGGDLKCTVTTICNDRGPALGADGLQVGLKVILTGEFKGAGVRGSVRMPGARIGDQLNIVDATIHNRSGPALRARGLQVGQDLTIVRLDASGEGQTATINLTNTRVAGTLLFAPTRIDNPACPQARIAVDGLTYSGTPAGTEPHGWLRWLQEATASYAAQPYQQLAAAHRAVGHDREAGRVLRAQQDDRLARTPTRRFERLWGWITKVTLGYGYQPWRALLFLTGTVILSCVLAVTLAPRGALAQTDKAATPGQPCTLWQQLSVGLDLHLPPGVSLARERCALTENSTSATATGLAAATWVLQGLAWAFAALFVAGFTSAVRKP